jgi:CDP-paratose 2-epimerase
MTLEQVVITGGAGFIGSNLANRLLTQGHDVTILDNLSRPGCETNLEWLRETHGRGSFRLVHADVADFESVRQAVSRAGRIYHLAGQVAVTTSVVRPREDFLANALGTFNVLEAARTGGRDPIVIYASTNKVYGGMKSVHVVEGDSRYQYADLPCGIPEDQAVDFHSPYGCSKGAGDQYTRDYARMYGLRTVVARQSCIYGRRQFGVEDQGWIVWFMIAALKRSPISIYGNGKQVRDVLFVEDLLDAYDAMVQHIDRSAGQIYNIGGGPDNTISVWSEFGPMLERLVGREIVVERMPWRPGDQSIYVSDIRRAGADLGWFPRVSVGEGIATVFEWVKRHEHLFAHVGGQHGLLVTSR